MPKSLDRIKREAQAVAQAAQSAPERPEPRWDRLPYEDDRAWFEALERAYTDVGGDLGSLSMDVLDRASSIIAIVNGQWSQHGCPNPEKCGACTREFSEPHPTIEANGRIYWTQREQGEAVYIYPENYRAWETE